MFLLTFGLLVAQLVSGPGARATTGRGDGEPEFLVQVRAGARAAGVVAETVETPPDDLVDLSGGVFTGAAVDLDAAEVRELRQDPRVVSVERNGPIRLAAQSWNLDRIDQQALPLDGAFAPVGSGTGTDIFIVDSGVDLDHPQFADRIGTSMVVPDVGSSADDCAGHGTHVAGTAASERFGVAAGSTIHPVRVVDCDGYGTKAGLIAGLNWIADNAGPRSVVNISLVGGRSRAVDAGVARLVARGIPVVVAAGNDGLDACKGSPSRSAAAVTIGATTAADRLAEFSGFGPCVNLLAPGSEISSVELGDPTGVAVRSGTSMAAPLVTGALAALWSAAPQLSGDQVSSRLLAIATRGRVSIPAARSATPNLLLQLPRAGAPAPGTRIDSGTSGRVDSRRAGFSFGTDLPAIRFECRLDSQNWRNCRSPVTYRGLGNGRHLFRVRARDWLDRVDPTPAVQRFTTARRVAVKLRTRAKRTRLRVNVNPNLGSGNYRLEVQQRYRGRWRVVRHARTRGKKEVRTINLGAGRYRVRVPAQRGLLGARSAVVKLRG